MIVDQILIDPWVWIEIGTPQKNWMVKKHDRSVYGSLEEILHQLIGGLSYYL